MARQRAAHRNPGVQEMMALVVNVCGSRLTEVRIFARETTSDVRWDIACARRHHRHQGETS